MVKWKIRLICTQYVEQSLNDRDLHATARLLKDLSEHDYPQIIPCTLLKIIEQPIKPTTLALKLI